MNKTLTTKEAEALLVTLEERFTKQHASSHRVQWSVIPKAKVAYYIIILLNGTTLDGLVHQ